MKETHARDRKAREETACALAKVLSREETFEEELRKATERCAEIEAGRRSARAALGLMDPEALADALLTDEGLRRDVAVSLVSCFEMEPTMARAENKANDDASREADGGKLFAFRRKDDVARETRARRARG